jgi:hypothetical protein
MGLQHPRPAQSRSVSVRLAVRRIRLGVQQLGHVAGAGELDLHHPGVPKRAAVHQRRRVHQRAVRLRHSAAHRAVHVRRSLRVGGGQGRKRSEWRHSLSTRSFVRRPRRTFTDSTTPNVLPAVSTVPTAGSSTYTTSPSSLCKERPRRVRPLRQWTKASATSQTGLASRTPHGPRRVCSQQRRAARRVLPRAAAPARGP